MEPASDDDVMTSYADRVGVDPWTPGALSLLRATQQHRTLASTGVVMGVISGSSNVLFATDGTGLYREGSAVTWGGSNSILSLVNDGTNYYAADSVGIYRGTLAGGAGSKIWDTGNASVTLGWAKQRLVAGIGAAIYELTTGGPTLPTALYTHPASGWTWSAITEAPGAILAAGYAGGESAIYKFVLSTAGVMPTLTSGIVAAKLPTGERVLSLYAYLGSYVAIGTNKGVRIGLVAENGDISYGPLVIESTQPVYALTGHDRFIYAGCTNQINSASGLWRIDLGGEREDGTFPYATDLQSGVVGDVRSVTIYGDSDRKAFSVSAQGVYLESATDLVTSGWMRTGYIRFNTVEPKQFSYVTARGTGAGAIVIESYDSGGTTNSVATIDSFLDQDFSLGRSDSEEYLALKFTLTRDTATTGPTLRSWQIKALPAITRSRIISVPVLLFERVRDSKGTLVPPQNIHQIINDLEALENAATPVLFAELCHGTPRVDLVVIDEIRYQQTAPPAGCQGDGGILYLTLRTVQ
jgi:hypothetical protein